MRTAPIIAGICFLSLTLSVATAEELPESDLALKFRALAPVKTEDWDSAAGVEAQLRFWNEFGVGLGLSIGSEQWNAAPDFYEESDGNGYYSMAVDGQLNAVPVGISLLQRWYVTGRLALILEAGVRYVFCDSHMTVNTVIDDAQGQDYYQDPIKVDNALVGVVGLTLEGDLNEFVAICGGIGCQMDLLKPHETYLGNDIGYSSLQAAVFSFGLAIKF
jgi:hypothetical protein